ncbi:MAG: VTC domain-containing protein [Planctomycetota bacterium]|jgi:hypothetical protein
MESQPMPLQLKSPERRGPRLELKFQLAAERSAEIFAWARTRMAADPHVQDPRDPIYTVESIYFDTPKLDCMRGGDWNRLPKYRARRYDSNQESMFLEEKLRRKQQVWKRRLPCQQDELAALVHGTTRLDGYREWFRTRFRVLRLRPTLVVIYRRWALVSAGNERLTIDRCIDAVPVGDGVAAFARQDGGKRIMDLDVLELKHPAARSTLMRELAAMAGQADRCSKYARGMRAFGYGRANGTGPGLAAAAGKA